MTAVDIHQRSHLYSGVLERNPQREHVVRRAGAPVGPVGMPADDGFILGQHAGFVHQGIGEEPDGGTSRQTGGDGAQDRGSANARTCEFWCATTSALRTVLPSPGFQSEKPLEGGRVQSRSPEK